MLKFDDQDYIMAIIEGGGTLFYNSYVGIEKQKEKVKKKIQLKELICPDPKSEAAA